MVRALLALALVACGGGKDGGGVDDTSLLTPGGNPIGGPGGTAGTGGTTPITGDCVDEGFDPIEPVVEFEQGEFDGFPTIQWIPENPTAVVFVLHGSGGKLSNLTGLHYIRSYNAWIGAGIGFIGTESTDRAGGTWDTRNRDPDRNDDMPRLIALRDHLIATTPMKEDTPIYSWGFSNGGTFSEDFAAMADEVGMPIRGFMSHNSAPGGGSGLPGFFTSAENDDNTPSAKAAAERHGDAGNPSVWHESFEMPWQVEHAMLHPQYDAEEAQDVFDEMVDFEMIAEDGSRVAPLDELERLMNWYTDNSVLNGPARMTTLIRVAWATHRPTSEFACEERAFMLEHL